MKMEVTITGGPGGYDQTYRYDVIDKLVSRRSENRHGGNGFIIGLPGSGKTLTAQLQILSILRNTQDEVIVIDTEGAHVALAEQMGGQVITYFPAGDVHINPFDIDMSNTEPDDPVCRKVDFICSWCESAFAVRYGLSAYQKSLIDKCVRSIYEPYIKSFNEDTGLYDESLIPTMRDFYDIIRAQCGFEAYELAEHIQIYATGTLAPLSYPTNVACNNRFVVYDLRHCNACCTDWQMVLMEHIWDCSISASRLRRGMNRIWLFIDDVHPLLRADASADYLRWFFKRARPYGCIVTGITQFASYLLDEDKGRPILMNCDYLHLLRMSRIDACEVSPILNLSDSQFKFLLNASPGQALVYLEEKITEISGLLAAGPKEQGVTP